MNLTKKQYNEFTTLLFVTFTALLPTTINYFAGSLKFGHEFHKLISETRG